nr:MAG TPA: hypothetical protein [Crassvirales sp.]
MLNTKSITYRIICRTIFISYIKIILHFTYIIFWNIYIY